MFSENREVARCLHAGYVDFLKQQSCPAKNYWPRRIFFSWAPPAAAGREQTAGAAPPTQ